jgi:ATP-dependent Zn protease
MPSKKKRPPKKLPATVHHQKRTPQELRATAYHEAGHAVAAIAQGLTIHKVSIVPGVGYYGVCFSLSVLHYVFRSQKERREIAEGIIIGCYAGLPAQQLVDPNPKKYHGRQDEDNAYDVSRRWEVLPRNCRQVNDDAHKKYLDRLRNKARQLVNEQRNAIAALAEELLQNQELDSAAAEAIVEPLLNKGLRKGS